MKKALLLLSFFGIMIMQAQVFSSNEPINKIKIEPGTYISNTKGQNIKLKLNDDKTYDLSFYYGNYNIKSDTIYFNTNENVSQKFIVKPIENTPFSSTLKLKLNYDLSYYYHTQVYIGTQTDENRKVNFKPIKAYFNDNNEDLTQQNIEIEKSKYLYFVDAKYDGTTVYKFEIPETVNEAEVEYNPYTTLDTKLNGYVQAETNKFVISDGKYPILFEFQQENSNTKPAFILPKTVTPEKNWLKNNGFDGDQATVETAAESYKPPYSFKHKRANSLNNALSEIKKTPNKFLIVSYDQNNKNAKTEFEEFIKASEETTSSYMYSEYVATYDKFNFYLANDNDKSLLTKNKILSDKEILVLNSNGAILYHTKGSLEQKKELFTSYSSIFEDLQLANEKVQFDNVMNSKIASIAEIKEALRKAVRTESRISVVPPPPAMDAVKFMPPVAMEEIKDTATYKIEEVKETVVDSAATVVEEAYVYEDYSLIKDKENLYELRATEAIVNEKWRKVLEKLKNNKEYDKDFVQIIKAELADTGFSQKLFPKIDYSSTNLEFELLDYVFANYNMILNPPKEKEVEVTESLKVDTDAATIADYEPYYYEQDLNTAISNYFQNRNFSENKQLAKLFSYYKKYMEISGYEAKSVQDYLRALKTTITKSNNEKEYLETFENYFNSIVKENTSIIENLDTAYSKKSIDNYDDWTSYKNSFANLSNDVSWHLVENSKDPNYLTKAIKWSETSLIIEKNNHYYLDTLAQLYYKTGNKQKAIETEQKAIDLSEDSINTQEYKGVLERMKNGTY